MFDINNLIEWVLNHPEVILVGRYIASIFMRVLCNLIGDKLTEIAKNHSKANKSGFND